MAQYLKKGSKVYIEGELETSKWTDNGVDKYKTEVIVSEFQFLDSKPQGEQAQQNNGFGNQPQQQQNNGGFGNAPQQNSEFDAPQHPEFNNNAPQQQQMSNNFQQ